ncbi:MAG: PSD1 domain-containing protein [Verrucomicrobiales bacterium]|nr:PSD1 domain-containing protein [Verrucomicrobiales bacterium]
MNVHAPYRRRLRSIATFAASVGFVLAGRLAQVLAADPIPPTSLSFERDVRPILKAHCFHCHGEGEKAEGGVDLRLRRLMLAPSDSGDVVVPGHPDRSVLVAKVASGEMPKGEKKLTTAQVEVLRAWVAQGAPTLRPEPKEVPRFTITEEERGFWSFQPIRRPDPPPVRHPEATRGAIDRFLLARLEEAGLGFAPPSEKPALLRRVTFDLTGLPPTPEETDAFLADTSPEAYERVVDRLLSSPRYGERWARHWLDVVGYADSNGGSDQDSIREWAWRYRDYVIRSFGADKPFDVFLEEQLAGDELVAPPFGRLEGRDLDRLIATGFLRLAPDPTGDGPDDPEAARNQVIADTLHVVSSSLLGLTVQCAQCHDHRYDPIPQSDYFRLRAVFEPAFDWKNWKNPDQRAVSLMAEADRRLAECVETAARTVDAEAQRLHDELIEAFVRKQLELVPENLRDPVMAARRTPADKRTDDHKRLLREFPTFQDHIILGEVDVPGAKSVEAVRKRAADFRAAKPTDPRVHCLVEEPGKNVDTFLFHRGDPRQPREKIAPGGLSVLPGAASADIPPNRPDARTTGRRLAFARSLTDGRHPLTPRVLVNRVWHHYFGKGLVATLGDFGKLGEAPTHPELLDWLASEFVASGWKLKSLHRTIVGSAAYRQSTRNPDARAVDPDNRLLGRAAPRRLDAESLRDAILAVSGRLDTTRFGAPIPVAYNGRGQVVVGSQNRDGNGDPTGAASLGGAEHRRSIYLQVRRTMPLGVLEPFDAPVVNPNCEIRPVSTVAPQALMLLNDQFVLDRSVDLAERLRREIPGDTRAQIARVWRLLFGVAPTENEIQRSLVFLAEQTETIRATQVRLAESRARKDAKAKPEPDLALQPDAPLLSLASLCQALVGSNRFLYLE